MSLSIAAIGKEIAVQIKGNDVERLLDDESLYSSFEASSASRKNVDRIKEVLSSERVPKSRITNILTKLSYLTVPAGTKGSIRGIKFNALVLASLKRLLRRHKHLELHSEKAHVDMFEKADWMIVSPRTKRCARKVLIGYNQLDLWHGGAQINRASKYVMDDDMHRRMSKKGIKVISVIARRPPEFKSTTNKVYKIFDVGFRKQRMFYLAALVKFIDKWAA